MEDYGEHLEILAVASWKNLLASVNSHVKEHAKKIRAKVHEIAPQRQMSEFEMEQLLIQTELLELQKLRTINNMTEKFLANKLRNPKF